jgi:hypothetical protein
MLNEFCDELNYPAYLNHEPESLHKPKRTTHTTVETQTESNVGKEQSDNAYGMFLLCIRHSAVGRKRTFLALTIQP